MNFVGHIHIAGHHLDRHPRSGQEQDRWREHYLFGSAVPDFAAIGRFQLRQRPDDPIIDAGIDMHHDTDNAFHGSDWFLTHSQALRSDLEGRGLNRGAARAVGHVGVELLLDGHLLATHPGLGDEAQQVLELAGELADPLGGLVTADHRADWVRHLHRISSWPLPDDYHRPLAVARRLHRILESRSRLAFDEEQVDMVADTLADAAAELLPGVPQMVEQVAAEVAIEAAP